MIERNDEISIGFRDANEFCLHLENIKRTYELDSYIETVCWYVENESDLEMESVVKHLNKKIMDAIQYEAINLNLLKDSTKETVSIF